MIVQTVCPTRNTHRNVRELKSGSSYPVIILSLYYLILIRWEDYTCRT